MLTLQQANFAAATQPAAVSLTHACTVHWWVHEMDPEGGPFELTSTEALIALVAVVVALLVVAPQLYALITGAEAKDKED